MNIHRNSSPDQVTFLANTQPLEIRSKTAAKETALKKRLNKVFDNCEVVFILADSKSQLQPNAKRGSDLDQAAPLRFDEQFFVQKNIFPKHALNSYCLNFHMPIQGCHLDLLILRKNQEKYPFNLDNSVTSYSLNRPAFSRVLKTYMVALLCEQLFKAENHSVRALVLNQSSPYFSWHFNQLIGAFVKSEGEPIFYIGHAEIKQTLLLQQHLKQSSILMSTLSPKLLMLQSFCKTFSKLELLLVIHSRFHFQLLQKLVLTLSYLKQKLYLIFVFKAKVKLK